MCACGMARISLWGEMLFFVCAVFAAYAADQRYAIQRGVAVVPSPASSHRAVGISDARVRVSNADAVVTIGIRAE